MTFAAEALERLSQRISEGDVVFFIGTGFSIDSEWNTADRLMKRLLIRFKAMCEALEDDGKEIAAALIRTFNLKADGPEPFPYTKADVERLADKYYESNDWFCMGFGRLLSRVKAKSNAGQAELWTKIAQREEEIRLGGGPEKKALDQTPFDRLPVELLAWFDCTDRPMDRDAGKALFLDTMGFRHTDIMGGEPDNPRADEAADSYEHRLLLRHHILARLAREGFCNTTLTTNYDLLLEGAFRVAGFSAEGCEELAPSSYFKDYTRIASPAAFFTKGKAHRTATVVKMHGCAQRYRDILPPDHVRLARYLRSMVFTYREIQNWRQDSWAADYLRTLLRTRTVVFSGYSLRDPVIHDTFRTVYEEMTEVRGRGETQPQAQPLREMAPAFFIGAAKDPNEFYGMEVLRAASAAVGSGSSPLAEHPNYLRFHFRSQPEFPHLDELFRWLFHSVFRLRQKDCLKNELEGIVALLLGGPRPDTELDFVRARFDAIWKQELDQAKVWEKRKNQAARARYELAAICGWSDGFGTALLREFACTDHIHRCRGPNRQLTLMRSLPWHCPTTQNSGWTCWGVVVELALRRMINQLGGCPDSTNPEMLEIRGVEHLRPTVSFKPGPDCSMPEALTIRFRGFEAVAREPRLWAQVRRRVFWELKPGDAPWPLAPRDNDPSQLDSMASGRRSRGIFGCDAPHARILWRWASGTETALDRSQLASLFGKTQTMA